MASQTDEICTDRSDDHQEMEFFERGCCFWIPCIGSNRGGPVGSTWWHRIGTVESNSTESRWFQGWMKVREWSELVAGPKWKTFIRTFRKNRHFFAGGCCGVGGGGGVKRSKFQYDPLSYALNFDEGPGKNSHFIDEDLAARDFSSRYASLPASAKSSMDLGHDAAPFT
ncbi:hypothetical protein EZV62_019887 [Acer yangbiense]|uniref:Uncharacterized protein n=1 Tax=Acer yangbiense TaxID=1000413 RepID=A0A5C7HCH1_9ROSI|nr:hypothetical protein EZV62_019887 [Acer yangbiense]